MLQITYFASFDRVDLAVAVAGMVVVLDNLPAAGYSLHHNWDHHRLTVPIGKQYWDQGPNQTKMRI